MFPRLPRLVRLALLVVVSVSLLLLFRSSDPGHSVVPHADAGMKLPRHLPSPAFSGPLPRAQLRRAGPTSRRLPPSSDSQPRTTASSADIQTQLLKRLRAQPAVNPHPFQYVLNPSRVCLWAGGRSAGLLVYIHSAPKNHKKRQSIRDTWGARAVLRRYNASLVFIMGVVPDPRLMQLVRQEYERYGDIVQEDFLDSYHNLTHKAVTGLKWAANFCPRATYILKTDDDILVNLHSVVKHIRHVVRPQYGERRLILCNQWVRMKIIRDKKSKWYIPEADFPGDYFPPYCSGSAFLLSGDMARLMYQASLVTPFFWVDDYYITGALIKALNVTHKRLNAAYSLNPGVAESKYSKDKKRELFFFHLHKLRLIYSLWRNMSVMAGVEKTTTTLSQKAPLSTAEAEKEHVLQDLVLQDLKPSGKMLRPASVRTRGRLPMRTGKVNSSILVPAPDAWN